MSDDIIPECTLDCRIKFGYGLGHILNDICASIWFTYSLTFYKLAYGSQAYLLVVIGQVMDAVTTVVIGLLFDAEFTSSSFFRLGKYKTWYFLGLLMVVPFFPISYSELFIVLSNQWVAFGGYVISICLSQTGWSFCQIAHMSLISELSITSADRIWMTAVRQSASIYSAIVVFALFWYTLSQDDCNLSKQDVFTFSNNAFMLVAYGIGHSIVFLFALKENELVYKKEQYILTHQEGKSNELNTIHWRQRDTYERLDWFKDVAFYQISFIYMFARLYINLPNTYMPLYLERTLLLPKSSIAIIPFVIYLTGFITSFLANYVENNFGNKCHLLLGIFFGMIASVWIAFGTFPSINWQLVSVAILLGISTTVVKIASISLVADLVGQNKQSTSFIYGTVSCFEKVLGGAAIGVLEQFNPDRATISEQCLHSHPVPFYYGVLSYGTAIIVLLLLVGLIFVTSVRLNL